jgi:hypothetical protein
MPGKVFLVTGQTMTVECWTSNSLSCTIGFDNVINRLVSHLRNLKDPWIGEDLLPVRAVSGFEKFGGGSKLFSIFLEIAISYAQDIRQPSQIRTPSHNTLASGSSRWSQTKAKFGLTQINSFPSTKTKGPEVNIVFVHGLGGSSTGTWIHPVTQWFWPEALAFQSGYEQARLMTFGYDSDWSKLFGPSSCLDFKDFAIQLLDWLEMDYRENGPVEPFKNGYLMY